MIFFGHMQINFHLKSTAHSYLPT